MTAKWYNTDGYLQGSGMAVIFRGGWMTVGRAEYPRDAFTQDGDKFTHHNGWYIVLDEKAESADLSRFLQLARQGNQPNASSGERILARFFAAIAFSAEDFAMVDREAINGACELIKALAGPWDTEAAKQAAFALLEKGRK